MRRLRARPTWSAAAAPPAQTRGRCTTERDRSCGPAGDAHHAAIVRDQADERGALRKTVHIARDPVGDQRLARRADVDLYAYRHVQDATVRVEVDRPPGADDAGSRGWVYEPAGVAGGGQGRVDGARQQGADAAWGAHRLDQRDLGVRPEAAGGAVDVVKAPAHERLGLIGVALVDERELGRGPDRRKADRLHEPPDIPAGGPVE